MKIAFATTLGPRGSTIIGRVLPLARAWSREHQVHLLLLEEAPTYAEITTHRVGREPFRRTASGKQRLSGLALLANMLATSLRTFFTLLRIAPDVAIITKPLPHNVLGVWLWRAATLGRRRIILDTDDFELSSNALSSLTQRAAIHWAERTAARVATVIVAATPFLADHFKQLTGGKRRVVLIPTGVDMSNAGPVPAEPHLLYLGSISIGSGHRIDLLPAIVAELVPLFPSLHVTIAGDGDDADDLRSRFKAAGLESRVTWHGRFDAEREVRGLLTAAAVVLDPIDASITQRAKSSYRVAVAAAAGRPVVTSNVGVRPYLIPKALHDRCFAEPADVQSYREKIAGWLTQPLSAEEAAALRSFAMKNSWASLAATYGTLL